MNRLDHKIFWPPFIILIISLGLSFFFQESFLAYINGVNGWILEHFDWLFNWASFLFVILLAVIYFSPFSKVKIGGAKAEPLLTKWKWFTICLCTTIATGILFWGSAEPMYHINGVPDMLNIDNRSEAAASFAMSTMFMHWTITPYAIYTVASLLFALCIYNLNQGLNLSALVFPFRGKKVNSFASSVINTIGLFALISGMAASLGTGILTIAGGLDQIFGLSSSSLVHFFIMISVVGAFTLSSSSGLMKGIRILSDYNIRAFILLFLFVAIFAPLGSIFYLGLDGITEYAASFFNRSTNIKSNLNNEWQQSWTVFYWANWLAWTPVTALFLGRISRGYSVRQFIHFNLLWPALFSGIWMTIFSGTAIVFDLEMYPGVLTDALNNKGAESVIYMIFSKLPLSSVVPVFFLIIVFISFVTAADSNTSAISSICTRNNFVKNAEGASWLKYLWGLIIGLVAFIMISTSGIDGVKILSTIGGFPVLFLMLICAIGLIRIAFFPSYFNRLISETKKP